MSFCRNNADTLTADRFKRLLDDDDENACLEVQNRSMKRDVIKGSVTSQTSRKKIRYTKTFLLNFVVHHYIAAANLTG